MPYFLGVDLGTTYTAAAIHRDGRTSTVDLGVRTAAIPSVVFLRDDETILTGEAASRRGATEPGRVAREFKRRVGDTTPILLGGSPYSADALMSRLLRWVVDAVTEREGERAERRRRRLPGQLGAVQAGAAAPGDRQGRPRPRRDDHRARGRGDVLRVAGAGRAGLGRSPCTTSVAARSTPPSCARRPTVSSCSAHPRASSVSAVSTSTRRCSPTSPARSVGRSASSIPTIRRRWRPCSACAPSASRPRRRCRPTRRSRSRSCCRTPRPRSA